MVPLPGSTPDSLSRGDAGIATIVGVSDWARRIRQDILGVAGHPSNVMITGPNGTGKEVVARAIHAHSPRSSKPFIPVDCAAFVSSLFPSHMFGHVKGAFTGAEYAAMGCFRAADGGTLFLDEIGELELGLQAKLLRVLQERVVVPVGGVEGIPVDVRIIVATNRDLQTAVDDGRFREDLYYRLNVVWLQTCGLKDRLADIDVLSRHFLEAMAREGGLPLKQLSPQAIRLLHSYHWPGNVRQLKNVLERAVIYSEEDVVCRESLAELLQFERSPVDPPTQVLPPPTLSSPFSMTPLVDPDSVLCDAEEALMGSNVSAEQWVKLSDLERYHIEQTLQFTFFNQTAASKLLGVTARVLAGKIKKYGISLARARRGRPRKVVRNPGKQHPR